MPVAIPMALGLALGVVMAVSGGPRVTKIDTSSLSATASPSASPAGPVSTANPANANCDLIVPRHPLTATGLASPWLLTGPGGQDPAASGCQQSNPALSAFVQATILDPATGRLWVYEPLVITLGSTPAFAPVVPRLPADAVVDIMVGFNGNDLQLVGAQPGTLARARCVSGTGDSLFGQVSYCDSVSFYAAAHAAVAHGKLRIPAVGISPVTGQGCPTTRSFDLVDQDPSDNVTTQYLLTAIGETAQDNAAGRAALPGAKVISNGSDNTLLDNFLLPALGCTPFTAPDLSADGAPGTSQTLDELSATYHQRAPIALVPQNDPMATINGGFSKWKTDLYRLGVGQPLVEGGLSEPFKQSRDGGQQADTPANFCANMLNIQSAFIVANAGRFATVDSPVPSTGSNLFTFMAARLSASFANLNCADFGLRDTVRVTLDGNGVATAATFNLAKQVPGGSAPAQSPSAAPSQSPGQSPSQTPAPAPSQSPIPAPSLAQPSDAGFPQPGGPFPPW